MAETRVDTERAFDRFIATLQAKYRQTVENLRNDWQVLPTFYDFPAEHLLRLHTTNPIESVFRTVRHGTDRTEGRASRMSPLAACADPTFQLAAMITGVRFVSGAGKDTRQHAEVRLQQRCRLISSAYTIFHNSSESAGTRHP